MSEDSGGLYSFDTAVTRREQAIIIGVDEAGRGPLAGPVVAAAVLLDNSETIEGINDSKKLSEEARETLFGEITRRAIAYGIAEASVAEIELLNILRASLLAMRRAIEQIGKPWTLALIDGNQKVTPFPSNKRQMTVVDGDAQSASIAAASILAKVTRDRMMQNYHDAHPEYEFNLHKGYATARHMKLIKKHGLSPIHRKSFCEHLVSQTELELFEASEA
jgi:ribonuclease HII